MTRTGSAAGAGVFGGERREAPICSVSVDELGAPPDAGSADPARLRSLAESGRLLRVSGLVDGHSHVNCALDLIQAARWGLTATVNMSGSPYHRSLALATADREDCCQLRTTTPVIDGPHRGVLPYVHGVTLGDPANADEVVATLDRAGYEEVKVYSHLDATTFDAIATAARARDLALVGHLPDAVSHRTAIRTGQLRFEHLNGFMREILDDAEIAAATGDPGFAAAPGPMQRLLASADWEAMRRLADDLAAAGAEVCPTLVIRRPMSARRRVSGVVVDPELDAIWSGFLADDSWRAPLLAFHLRVLEALARAGVRIIAGTDAPDPFTYHGPSLYDEIDLLRSAGLDTVAAFDAASVGAGACRSGSGRSGPLGPAVLIERGEGATVDRIRGVVDHHGVVTDPPGSSGAIPPVPTLGTVAPTELAEVAERLRDGCRWHACLRFVPAAGGDEGGLDVWLREDGDGTVAVLEDHRVSFGRTVTYCESHRRTLTVVSSHVSVGNEALYFQTTYAADRPGVLHCFADHLDESEIPILHRGRPAAASGNLSLFHPLFVSAASARSGAFGLAALWGGYPDSEFGHVSPLRVDPSGQGCTVLSRLGGGLRLHFSLDPDGFPTDVAVTNGGRTSTWRRASRHSMP
ncbi:MAG: hypothetical protein ACRD0A_02565 [Acidimicrobiales bacterium]